MNCKAYTAIELMVVMTIMLIMLGLGISGVVSTMRRAAVNQAVVAITSTGEKARSLSIASDNLGGAVATVFGVVISDDPVIGFPLVALTMGQKGDGFVNDHIKRVAIIDTAIGGLSTDTLIGSNALSQLNTNSNLLGTATSSRRPLSLHKLKSTAIPYVFSGTGLVPLRTATSTNCGWYYHQGSGALITSSGSSQWPIDAYPCELGKPGTGRTWTNLWMVAGQPAVPGKKWTHTIANILPGMTVTTAGQPFPGLKVGDEVPGLVISSPDGGFRMGVTGSAIGQLLTRTF